MSDLLSHGPPVLDVVVPVHNEEADLEPCVRRLHAHLRAASRTRSASPSPTTPAPTRTVAVARRLAAELPDVEVVRLDEKGRGRALRTAWSALRRRRPRVHGRRPVHRPRRPAAAGRPADLRPLRPRDRHPAVAVGSRVVRGAKREFISRGYNLLLRGTLRGPLLRRPVRVQGDPRATWPARCCRWSRTPAGSSTPSCWCSPSARACASTRCRSTGSTTRTPASTSCATALADLRGIARLAGRWPPAGCRVAGCARRRPPPARPGPGRAGRAGRPAGPVRRRRRAVSTARLPAALLAASRRCRRPGGQLLALLLTAVANTAANRRLTFGVRGRGRRRRGTRRRAWSSSPSASPLTSGSLAALHAADATPVARGANSACWSPRTSPPPLLRFLLFRAWVFRPDAARHLPHPPTALPAVAREETAR